jgi:hypothetical protein
MPNSNIQTFTYEILQNDFQADLVKRTDSQGFAVFIPKDENNSDYAAYLESLKPVEKPKSK